MSSPTTTFTVREGVKRAAPWESESGNVAEFDFDPEIEYDEGAIWIESMDDGYGCEGGGHFLGTRLEPGRYRIERIDS